MHIIYFEGLGPLDCIRRQLIEPLRSRHSFTHQGYDYKDKGPTGTPTGPLIVIGHSFGGDAAFRWASSHRLREISLFLTLDPRRIALIPEVAVLRNPFYAPKNAKLSANFYQTFPLWGAKVSGATNVKVSWGHTRVPGQPEVRRYLSDFLKDYGAGQ